jgi:putative membrane protein
MQNPGGPYQGPYGGSYGGASPHGPPPPRYPWLFIGLAVMLGLIGVAVLFLLLFPASFGYHPASTGFGPFGYFGAFFLFFVFIMIVLAVVRIALWSSRVRGYGGRPGYGRGRRYGAFAIARERYARGEITREQFDQIMQDLQRRPGYPPPP